MSSITFQHNITERNRVFSRKLTAGYFLTAPIYLLEKVTDILDSTLNKLINKVIKGIDNTARIIIPVYEVANDLSSKDAKDIYPLIVNLRRTVLKQDKKYSDISYADSEELRVKFKKLIRLINRTEARIYARTFEGEQERKTPNYIKDSLIICPTQRGK